MLPGTPDPPVGKLRTRACHEVLHLHPRCEPLQFVFFAEYSLADDQSIVELNVMAADDSVMRRCRTLMSRCRNWRSSKSSE